MWGKSISVICVGVTVALGGCAVDAQISYMPEMLKQPPQTKEIEQPPDIGSIIGRDLKSLFTEASAPTNISFSFPIPDKYGGWTTCIRASVHGATGRAVGMQTYLVDVEHNQIGRREHVNENHWCAKESYQPL